MSSVEIAFPEPKSPELQDILHGFLEKDPTERISLEDASEHVWFMKMQLKKSHDEPSMRVTVTDEDIKQAIGRRNSQTKSNFMAPQSEGGGTFTKDTRRKMSIIQAPGQTNIWEAQSSGANSNQMDKMAEEEDESASPAPSPVAEPAALSPTDPSIPATSTAASAAPTAASTAAVVDQIGKKKKEGSSDYPAAVSAEAREAPAAVAKSVGICLWGEWGLPPGGAPRESVDEPRA
eukprot:CAMPEP_0205907992 /NCGR_PEP_ID=MMETSP1325-20131115/2917_1 /ASSEMBLY_ACC=CAM_ASM_000708 /TAXON_ID=236786 /ORGANISM="Florenciella sp., Strain RCC1007" /LENGTH=233 /DNA_ID=CAMNT_0053274153 /DNA_START=59 /DNA_END=761 /DNA_ORIENTATION=-